MASPPASPPPPAVTAADSPLEAARRDYLQARQLLEQHKHEEAQRLLAGVLERLPTWSLPKLALAQSLRQQGSSLSERERLLREAVAVDPENHQILYELGLVHEEAARRREAIDCYRGAIARRPDLVHAQERLGVLLTEEGELDEARGHLEVVAAAEHGNLVAVSLLAVVLEGLHRLEDAEERLKQLVALAQDQPYVHARLAAFYQRQGKTAAMNEEMGKARRLLEKFQPVRPKMRPLADPPPRKPRSKK